MIKLNFKEYLFILVLILGLYSCSEDDEIQIEYIEPTISNIVLGAENKAIGIIGEDFHFNADVTAGHLIDEVIINIVQKNDETYLENWNFEVIWEEYNGSENAEIHQAFEIPEDAVSGRYDYVITVLDQNGLELEETKEILVINDSEQGVPTISEVEVGLKNNEIGVVGEDFHFNAEILAGYLIDSVKVNIIQRNDIIYSDEWTLEVTWDKYKGEKEAKIHQHFDIPADAPKGKYDYMITATDQNGTILEEVRTVYLIDAEDYPEVNPHVKVFGVDKIDANGASGYYNFFSNGEFRNPEDPFFSKGESIWGTLEIGSIKGDGIMYGLLIKKSDNHLPETVEFIDFSKAIVTEVVEHSGYEAESNFRNSNNTNYNNHYLYGAPLEIGATVDNNLPQANPIASTKAWENGIYYYGVVYTNYTYGLSTFKYIEFEIRDF